MAKAPTRPASQNIGRRPGSSADRKYRLRYHSTTERVALTCAIVTETRPLRSAISALRRLSLVVRHSSHEHIRRVVLVAEESFVHLEECDLVQKLGRRRPRERTCERPRHCATVVGVLVEEE